MRSNNVLLFIALIAINCAYAFEFGSLAEVKELRASTYGNSLIETISLSLDSKDGSIKNVQNLLTELLFKLNLDQDSSDAKWEKTNARLNKKIASLKNDIVVLIGKISANRLARTKNSDLVARSQKNLSQYRAQLAGNAVTSANLEINRKNDNDLYKQSSLEHDAVIRAIKVVVTELKKLIGSVSGVGKPTHVKAISQEVRDNIKTAFTEMNMEQSELLIFAQLATTADQAALKRLIKLLKELSRSTKLSFNSDEAHETSSVNSYNTLKAILAADNVKLNAMIKSQEEHLVTYETEVKRLRALIREQKNLQASKEKEQKATETLRMNRETQYKSDRAERANEKKVILRLQKIVNERLASMSNFLRTPTGGF